MIEIGGFNRSLREEIDVKLNKLQIFVILTLATQAFAGGSSDMSESGTDSNDDVVETVPVQGVIIDTSVVSAESLLCKDPKCLLELITGSHGGSGDGEEVE